MLNYKNYWTFRKKRLETCLNGKTANFKHFYLINKYFSLQSKKYFGYFVFNKSNLYKQLSSRKIKCCCFKEHDSVLNQLLPRKQPGLYMIRCLKNDWRYYGESSNISGRLASHKSLLNRKIHPNKILQNDWDLYSQNQFDFIILFMGDKWELAHIRRAKETELIVLNRDLAYNILECASKPGEKNPFWKRLHSPEAKQKISQALKGRPNNLLGKKISIKNTVYPSIAEASRQTNISRKTIRQKLNDDTNQDYKIIE